MDEEKEISKKEKEIRIGVVIDGHYFDRISFYYLVEHLMQKHLHLGAFYEWIRHKVAEINGVHVDKCHIVESQRFLGVPDTSESLLNRSPREQDFVDHNIKTNVVGLQRDFEKEEGKKKEREVENEERKKKGLEPNTAPLNEIYREKGVDPYLAMRALLMAAKQDLDIIVLISGDGDFQKVPMVIREACKCKTMLLHWEYDSHTQEGKTSPTRTSHELLKEVHYNFEMHSIIEKGIEENDKLILNLFEKRFFGILLTVDSKIQNRGTVIFSKDGKEERFRFHRNNPLLGMNFGSIVVGGQYFANIEEKNGRLQACDFQPAEIKLQTQTEVSKGGSQS